MRLHTKIGYGIAELGISAVDIMIKLFLLIFYTDKVGLDAKYAGYAVALAVIWDAITDPIIGIMSDNTNNRRGKRSPYILLGGITLSVSVIVIMNPPQMTEQTQQFLYLLVSYILLNTSMTILSIPHSALGGDLTINNKKERIEVYGWRFLFVNLGALTAALVQNATAIAVIVFITSLITYAAIHKLDKKIARKSNTYKESQTLREILQKLKQSNFLFAIPYTLRNVPFRYLLSSYIIATIGLTINTTLALYYYKYHLQLDQKQIDIIIGLFLLVICISVLFWVLISQKYGKKWPAFCGIFALAIMTIICYPLFPKQQIFFPLCTAVFGGIMAGSTALLDALVADVVDCDSHRENDKKEGLYFGVWRMGAKVARAVAIAICGVWLSAIGFQANQEQLPQVSIKIAYMFGPGVGILLMIAVVIFFRMPKVESESSPV